MGSDPRRKLPDLIQAVLDDGPRFDFFQALLLIEREWGHGRFGEGLEKRLRVRPSPALHFPATDIQSVEFDDDNRLDMRVTFMGLYGIDAPMPHYMLRDMAADDEAADVLRAFLDIFHQRVYVLMYQAWKKYRAVVHLEQHREFYLRFVSALSGWALNDMDKSELAFAGLVGRRIRNAEALSGLLSDFLGGAPVYVEQFKSRWVELDHGSTLGGETELRLGDNVMIGERLVDITGKVEVRVGPLPADEAMRLMFGTENGLRLSRLITRYLPANVEYDLALLIQGGALAETPLGGDDLVLGWSTWLGNEVEGGWEMRMSGAVLEAQTAHRRDAADLRQAA